MIENNFSELKKFCHSKISKEVCFSIPPVSKSFVKKCLSELDTKKATGLDQIGPRLIKSSASAILDSITFIINLSIATSSVPKIWKTAKVTPIYKSGSKNDADNYRPISILPNLSKLIEKHVHDSFMSYLTKHLLLHPNQSGFRQKHSCETALISLTDKWLQALDQGKIIGSVFVDFRKAFDMVDHEILLKKLKIYQCDEKTIRWFTSYLSERTQHVYINNVLSEPETIRYGVPQGSILGPLLFI